jgi:hypothetical protein
MKNSASKITLFTLAVAVSSLFAMPAAFGADDAEAKKAERKAKRDAEIIRKYDANGNGVLDPDEQAAKKADENKAKAERAEKKKAKDAAKDAAKDEAKAQPAEGM